MVSNDKKKKKESFEEENSEIKRQKQELENIEINNLLSKIEEEFSRLGIIINNFDDKLKSKCLNNGLEFTKKIVNQTYDQLKIYGKYINKISDEEIQKIISKEFFLGMTEEMLIDSIGKPTKIEKDVQKTKTKLMYIYGTKSGGDVFVFHDGILNSYKDR
jgi:3'-phosphoadenosine 5'-phosphosulfate sulfotransferase